jgi:hypothetical protein
VSTKTEPTALLFHGVHVPRNDSEIASEYCLPISMGVCQRPSRPTLVG